MFNFYNRHYIFRQSNGEIRDIFCDSRQNLCSCTLTRKGIWSEAAVLNRNVNPYFYAELDQENKYHILFQDSNGNINYSMLEGQSARTIPVLNSKTPSVYNKHLYIAPLKESIYLFYVLQHDNSFLLAYQLISKNKAGTPKIVDYVSGSNIPCALLYDSFSNIYAFYQSYDGKYLQLGYKKFNTVQKHWSDFSPVTKYNGNCEYPHAIIDSCGTIHLCYQRRAPKLFEMVYQQKAPDRNLWSSETVLHSSIHSFENASILQIDDRVTVYWIRDDVIYYSAAPLSGEGWSKPARYGSQLGRQFRCVCYKDQIEREAGGEAGGRFICFPGDGSLKGDSPSLGDLSSLSPGIYPGIVSNGFNLAFTNADSVVGGSPFPQFPPSGKDAALPSEDEIKKLVLGAFKQMQESISEVRTGWSEAKKEMTKLTNAYIDLTKEIGKYSVRLNMLESKLSQLNNPYRKAESVLPGINTENLNVPYSGTLKTREAFAKPENYSHPDKSPAKLIETSSGEYEIIDRMPGQNKKSGEPSAEKSSKNSEAAERLSKDSAAEALQRDSTSELPQKDTASGTLQKDITPSGKPGSSLDPDALKAWEEWQEPREWSEGG